jgi:hypothetical protein
MIATAAATSRRVNIKAQASVVGIVEEDRSQSTRHTNRSGADPGSIILDMPQRYGDKARKLGRRDL